MYIAKPYSSLQQATVLLSTLGIFKFTQGYKFIRTNTRGVEGGRYFEGYVD